MISKMSAPIEEAGALTNLWQANPPFYNTNLKEFKAGRWRGELWTTSVKQRRKTDMMLRAHLQICGKQTLLCIIQIWKSFKTGRWRRKLWRTKTPVWWQGVHSLICCVGYASPLSWPMERLIRSNLATFGHTSCMRTNPPLRIPSQRVLYGPYNGLQSIHWRHQSYLQYAL